MLSRSEKQNKAIFCPSFETFDELSLDWNQVRYVVSRTLNGLQNMDDKLVIKIVKFDKESVRGGVRYRTWEEVQVTHTDGRQRHISPENKDLVYMGQIKIADSIYRQGFDELFCKTLIHEATHRFASTLDIVYFHRRENDKNTFFTAPGDHSGWWYERVSADKPMPKTYVLNADSYAWAAMTIPPLLRINQ